VSHAASIPLAAIGQHCVWHARGWHARGWHSKITSMYCPVCGAEYRPGFTECSDCQVALVAEPPHASSDERSAEYSSYVTVWSGDDPLKHAEILESLDEAGIPTRDLNREDRSFHLVTMPAFEVFVPDEFADSAQEVLKQIAAIENPDEPGSGIFEIPAEEDVPDEDDYGQHSPGARAGSSRAVGAARGQRMGADDEHEDANVEVWSGQDAATANMIALSLRENEIPFRRDPNPREAGAADSAARREPDRSSPAQGGLAAEDASTTLAQSRATTIFVYPEDERRAREIIREILNAAPPE
jgi:hypothetical protein